MNRSRLIYTLATFVVAMSFSSCQKLIDRIFNRYENKEFCDIVKVKQGIGTDLRTGIVYNNSHGDPDSVIFDMETGSAGASYFYFKYDELHRLVEYSGWYSRSEGDFYFIHRYGYSNNRIIYDTTQWREAGSWTRMAHLEYDAAGRVIKENLRDTLLDGEPGTSTDFPPINYLYNADGNLSGPQYDDKVNFLRTNDVWMFTQRNYSKNNPVGAIGYNEEDLPLGFSPGEGILFLQQGGPAEIEYDCKEY